MALLMSRLCGHDGGVVKPRFQNRTHADLTFESDPVKYTVIRTVLSAVRTKSLKGWKESVFADHMELKKEDFLDVHSSDVYKQAAPLLPLTYKQALTMLTKTGACVWHTQIHYTMCNRCEFIYRCEARYDKVCPLCDTPKDKENTSTYIHMPIAGHMRYLWGNVITAELMARARERISQDPNIIQDINDVCNIFQYDPNLPATNDSGDNNPQHMSIQFSQDPFMPYGDDNSFSNSPCIAIVNNLPPELRQKTGFVHLYGIGPGTRNNYEHAPKFREGVSKTDRHKFAIVVDEAIFLDLVGIDVVDAYATKLQGKDKDGKDRQFRCRLRITNIISDFRGMEEVVGFSGTPSYYGCLICWWTGHKVGGKTLYEGHRKLLPFGDRLRLILKDMHIPKAPAASANETPAQAADRVRRGLNDLPPALRSHKELAGCAVKPVRPIEMLEGEASVVQHCE